MEAALQRSVWARQVNPWTLTLLALGSSALAGCGERVFSVRDVDARTLDLQVGELDLAGADGARSCASAALLQPAATFRDGPACNEQAVTREDGVGAGLDRGLEPNPCFIDTALEPVCSCVGIDLGGVYPIGSVTVSARAAANACGTACKGADCGTGRSLLVGSGLERGSYPLAKIIELSGEAWQTFELSWSAPARVVVACRRPFSEFRDDLEVDLMQATCPR